MINRDYAQEDVDSFREYIKWSCPTLKEYLDVYYEMSKEGCVDYVVSWKPVEREGVTIIPVGARGSLAEIWYYLYGIRDARSHFFGLKKEER